MMISDKLGDMILLISGFSFYIISNVALFIFQLGN